MACLSKCKQRKEKSNVNLNTIHENRLNEMLRKFYAEVKAEKKSLTTKSVLTGIQAALNRTIKHAPYNRCIDIIGAQCAEKAN